jgi:hypothetical protein
MVDESSTLGTVLVSMDWVKRLPGPNGLLARLLVAR